MKTYFFGDFFFFFFVFGIFFRIFFRILFRIFFGRHLQANLRWGDGERIEGEKWKAVRERRNDFGPNWWSTCAQWGCERKRKQCCRDWRGPDERLRWTRQWQGERKVWSGCGWGQTVVEYQQPFRRPRLRLQHSLSTSFHRTTQSTHFHLVSSPDQSGVNHHAITIRMGF